jgi:hypothetical protein
VTRIDQETTATTEEEQVAKKSTRKKKTEDRIIADRLTAGTIRDLELLSDYTPQYLLVVKVLVSIILKDSKNVVLTVESALCRKRPQIV